MDAFTRLVNTVEKNATNNQALIVNVSLWAKFWRNENATEKRKNKFLLNTVF